MDGIFLDTNRILYTGDYKLDLGCEDRFYSLLIELDLLFDILARYDVVELSKKVNNPDNETITISDKNTYIYSHSRCDRSLDFIVDKKYYDNIAEILESMDFVKQDNATLKLKQ